MLDTKTVIIYQVPTGCLAISQVTLNQGTILLFIMRVEEISTIPRLTELERGQAEI